MALALRPAWPERWMGGLDKKYRLHKWLGIGVLVLAVVHWLWSQGPKWAVGLGWLERSQHGPAPEAGAIERILRFWPGTADSLGELALHAAVVLIAVALIRRISCRLFYRNYVLLAVVFAVLVFHSVVLLDAGSRASGSRPSSPA